MRSSHHKLEEQKAGTTPLLNEYLRIWNPRGEDESDNRGNAEAFREGERLAQAALKEMRDILTAK